MVSTAKPEPTLLGSRQPSARRRRTTGAKAAAKLAEAPPAAQEAPEPPVAWLRISNKAETMRAHPGMAYLWSAPCPSVSLPRVFTDEAKAESWAFSDANAQGAREDRERYDEMFEAARKRVHLPRQPFHRVPVTTESPDAGDAVTPTPPPASAKTTGAPASEDVAAAGAPAPEDTPPDPKDAA